MMNYEEFASEIYKWINDFPPFMPALVDVMKANDCRCKGIVIQEPDAKASADGLKVSPVIYLEEYYQKYLEGQEISNIAENIIELYSGFALGRNELEQDIAHLKDYADWETAKDHVFCRLCNAESSSKYLKDKPYTQIEDLAATYHVLIEEFREEGYINSFTVDVPLLKKFGVSTETLHQTALENTQRLFPAKVESMESIFADAGIPVAEEGGIPAMLVVSNKEQLFGAAEILDREVQEEARQVLGGDFIILPSSVHEVLLVPKPEDGAMIREMEEMVQEINASVLSPRDVLSDHVYDVDWVQHRVVQCRNPEALQIKQTEKETGKPQETPGRRKPPKPAGPKL